MEIPEEEKQRQLARAGEYSQEGLPEFIIAGMVIITAALGLRLWSRRMVKIDLKSDDYTLIVAWVSIACPLPFPTYKHHNRWGGWCVEQKTADSRDPMYSSSPSAQASPTSS